VAASAPQTNPASSRATATTALGFIARRAVSRLNFPLSQSCAVARLGDRPLPALVRRRGCLEMPGRFTKVHMWCPIGGQPDPA